MFIVHITHHKSENLYFVFGFNNIIHENCNHNLYNVPIPTEYKLRYIKTLD